MLHFQFPIIVISLCNTHNGVVYINIEALFVIPPYSCILGAS